MTRASFENLGDSKIESRKNDIKIPTRWRSAHHVGHPKPRDWYNRSHPDGLQDALEMDRNCSHRLRS